MLPLKMDVTESGNSSSMCMTISDLRHMEVTAAQREQKGLGAMETARWLEVSLQDSGQKKMGEERRRERMRVWQRCSSITKTRVRGNGQTLAAEGRRKLVTAYRSLGIQKRK